MKTWVCVFLSIVTPALPDYARASGMQAGVAIGLAHAIHRESSGTAEVPIIPVPIVNVSQHLSRFEVTAEALPPLGPTKIANNGLGIHDFTLTYLDGTLRYWNRAQTFAIGVGESLYTQQTHLVIVDSPSMQESETNSSRVGGAEYEMVGRLHANARDFWEARIAVNPAMHGRFSYTEQTTLDNGQSFETTAPPTSETASEIDISVRYVRAFERYEVSYGVRYLNYSAAFSARNGSPFADSNSLLMPYVQLDRLFGR